MSRRRVDPGEPCRIRAPNLAGLADGLPAAGEGRDDCRALGRPVWARQAPGPRLGSSAPIDPAAIGVAAICNDPTMLRRARPMGVELLTLAEVRSIAARPPSPSPAVAMVAILAVVFLLRSSWSAAG